MPKDRYSEEEVQRILQNAIRADADAPAEFGFSADDVRRIAGELGIDSARLDFNGERSDREVTERFGLIQRITFRARLEGDAELTFERALSVLHRQFRMIPQNSERPRGREMINLEADTRCRLSVTDGTSGVQLEYLRDLSMLNIAPFMIFYLALPLVIGMAVYAKPIYALWGFLIWIVIAALAYVGASFMCKSYLRREEALWAKILAECRAN